MLKSSKKWFIGVHQMNSQLKISHLWKWLLLRLYLSFIIPFYLWFHWLIAWSNLKMCMIWVIYCFTGNFFFQSQSGFREKKVKNLELNFLLDLKSPHLNCISLGCNYERFKSFILISIPVIMINCIPNFHTCIKWAIRYSTLLSLPQD